MKWTLCPVGSLLLAIAPMIAQGADVPVSYLVNLSASALRAKRLATRVPSAGELDGGDELLTG